MKAAITAALTRLLGRLPIGWLQLTHNPARMAAAMAGVSFANVLVFVQLGVLGALYGSVDATYAPIKADILISANDAKTLTDGSPLSRRILWQAMVVQGVATGAPLYLGLIDWTRQNGTAAKLLAYGIPAEGAAMVGPQVAPYLPLLTQLDYVLVDRLTRGADRAAMARTTPTAPIGFEVNGRALTAIGNVAFGGGFVADGTLIGSDQTFFALFPRAQSGTPNQIMLQLASGADPADTVARLRAHLAAEPVIVQTLSDARAADRRYQLTQRPVGVVFGFGVFIGLLVGVVIVYQVLSTDVADHMREYATFKAMGYRHRFFIGIVFEQAAILGTFGFLPGFALVNGLYRVLSRASGLTVEMTASRAVMVFAGTLVACAISGALATRRLHAADPAELFG